MSVLIDAGLRVLVQGVTGREGSLAARDMLDYGTAVVAGVVPGRAGREVHGVPVYGSVKDAMERRPTAAMVSVPPPHVRAAALEALDAGIPLVLVVTERVPRRDVSEIRSAAAASGARLLGPNSLGVIAPEKAKLGMIGGPAADARRAYSPGPVGVMSRSGGMTTEIATQLTLAGLGQSACVSVGGEPMVGSTFADLFPLFQADPETRAVVCYCEPGGTAEEDLAALLRASARPKPVVAFLAGRFADRMQGMRFGHAAVIVEGERGSAESKLRAFEAAGVRVAARVGEIPALVREAVGGAA